MREGSRNSQDSSSQWKTLGLPERCYLYHFTLQKSHEEANTSEYEFLSDDHI